MPYLAVLCLLIANDPKAQSPDPLLQARQRWLRGNYEEAAAAFEALAKDPKHTIAATIGWSRCLESQGKYDEAASLIDAAIAKLPAAGKPAPGQALIHARQAELAYLRGNWEGASAAVDKALAIHPDNLQARWIRSQVLNDRGDTSRADSEFRWFVRTYTERSNRDDDIKDPDELLIVGLAGAENARWHKLSDQFKVILNDVYGDAIQHEPAFWPAEYEAGMLLLEKYNRPEALAAFDKALTINPNAAEVYVAKAQAALQKYEVKDAELHVERALRINPNLPAALRTSADLHLMAGDYEQAGQQLDRARQINPRDARTLARRAARLFFLRDQKGFDALVQEAQKWDARPGIFFLELGERLEDRKHYVAAEKYYKQANQLRPMLPWAQNSLGLLYMRLGDEKEALRVLEEAFKADEFNVRVSNSIKVLQHLQKYETIKTAHFEIRFDPQNDKLLARYLANYLEETYAGLVERFQFRPARPFLFEVFNNHEMFSGRVVNLPDLHTIGACTGRVVAMVSPNGRGLNRPFNWGRVARHELVHLFNLEQTGFQVPHWLTEGLAVANEGFPRPAAWNQLLRERVPADNLMNLDTIDLGFIRPRSPVDWHMAYCQSHLYVEYIKTRFGPAKIGELLAAYQEGLETAAAILKVCRLDKAAFEKGYRAYLQETVASIQGRAEAKKLTFSQLQKAFEDDPKNLEVAAQLAEQSLLRRDRKRARQLAEDVLAKKNTHPLALYVKARLLRDAGEDDTAAKLLEQALDPLDPEPKVVQALGAHYYEARKLEEAARTYELGHKAEPYESKWLTELVRVYGQLEDRSKLIRVLSKLVPMDPDDLEQRKRLAGLLIAEGNHAEAERIAREGLEIDVRDQEVFELLQKALEGQKKTAELEKIRQLLGK